MNFHIEIIFRKDLTNILYEYKIYYTFFFHMEFRFWGNPLILIIMVHNSVYMCVCFNMLLLWVVEF